MNQLKTELTIGYYPLRGKAQVCRLLCHYLQVPFHDKHFSLQEWDLYKKEKASMPVKELPFLAEGKFVVTGSIPMCLYVIDRFGKEELLGRDLKDQAIVDMYLWTIDSMSGIINLNCQKKSEEQIQEFKESQWTNAVAPKIQKYEDFAQEGGWFLGYLTIIDFSIYELVRYMEMLFGPKMQKFPRLQHIKNRLAELPQIKIYECSPQAVKEMCPTSLLKQLKDKAEATK